MKAIVESNGDREADYFEAVDDALVANRAEIDRWITQTCTECGKFVDDEDDQEHLATRLDDGTLVLLIGCEGYFLINPNAVGLDAPNWQDWTETSEEQPKLPDWAAKGTMRKWTFRVPHAVIQWKTVTTQADSEPQAVSNMLAAMLDAGLDVQTNWQLQGTEEVGA